MDTRVRYAADIAVVPGVRDSLARNGERKQEQAKDRNTVQNDFDDRKDANGVGITEHLLQVLRDPTRQQESSRLTSEAALQDCTWAGDNRAAGTWAAGTWAGGTRAEAEQAEPGEKQTEAAPGAEPGQRAAGCSCC